MEQRGLFAAIGRAFFAMVLVGGILVSPPDQSTAGVVNGTIGSAHDIAYAGGDDEHCPDPDPEPDPDARNTVSSPAGFRPMAGCNP